MQRFSKLDGVRLATTLASLRCISSIACPADVGRHHPFLTDGRSYLAATPFTSAARANISTFCSTYQSAARHIRVNTAMTCAILVLIRSFCIILLARGSYSGTEHFCVGNVVAAEQVVVLTSSSPADAAQREPCKVAIHHAEIMLALEYRSSSTSVVTCQPDACHHNLSGFDDDDTRAL